MNQFDLTGRAAFVTGAAHGGLGYFSALALAEHGADVFLVDLPNRADDLARTKAVIQETGRRAEISFCDVSDEGAVDDVVSQAIRWLGKVDILVHSAGVMLRKDTFDTTLAEWQRVIDINLTGTWIVNRRIAREMVSQEHGKIINTSTLYTNIVGFGKKVGVRTR